MENQKRKAVLAVLVLLFLCLAGFAFYLFLMAETPLEQTAETSTHGMVLLDIADQEAAAFYHVEQFGVYVLAVDEDSPAYRAGVRSGDRIETANGMQVFSTDEFVRMQEAASSPDGIEIVFCRDREPFQLKTQLGYEDTLQ